MAEDFTSDIAMKVAVLTEYGVERLATYIIAGSSHLDEIRYLARQVEGEGDPADAAARIVCTARCGLRPTYSKYSSSVLSVAA